MDPEIILEDKHAQQIIVEILKCGGEARYSQLRALAEKEKKMPIATFQKRLRQLVEYGILETPQPKNKTKVPVRTYRLNHILLKDLESAYSQFHQQVTLALENAEKKTLAEELIRLRRQAYETIRGLLSKSLAASLKNPELLKGGTQTTLLVMNAIIQDWFAFANTMLARLEQEEEINSLFESLDRYFTASERGEEEEEEEEEEECTAGTIFYRRNGLNFTIMAGKIACEGSVKSEEEADKLEALLIERGARKVKCFRSLSDLQKLLNC
jgi:predicted transcriptional regulator